MTKIPKKILKKYPYFDESLPLEERVDLLLERLTLSEKFKLLSGRHFSLWTTKPIRRLRIRKLGMSDGPVGVSLHSSFRKNTKFPTTKALAATWNRSLAKECGKAIAQEVRAVGRQVLLAPGINIDRTPLNGRTFEYFSEDPYLTKELAIPFVKGAQSQRVAACLKHFVANNQETNRHKVSAEVDERTLQEIYLRAFRETVREADPWVVMGSYNKINGVYGCAHKKLLRDALMDDWGFKGYVVSDWWATKRIAEPEKCIKAGLTLEMPRPYAYTMRRLRKAFNEGLFTDADVDSVVRRLLRVMFLVGLFDQPQNIPEGKRNTPEIQNTAKKIAEEGMVLLKNDGNLLPLNEESVKKIAILGPNADRKFGRFLYGGSAAVVPPFEITPKEGLKRKYGTKISFVSDPRKADCCLIFAGLNHNKGKDCENVDRKSLELPAKQVNLIKTIARKNLNTIVVLINGSPLSMEQWIDDVPVVLEAWYPGMFGGEIIADTLFGKINPSGKLPITFPKELTDSPAHKNKRTFPGNAKVHYEEGIFVGYRHFDSNDIEPQFPFGFGLSYTSFEYKDLKIKNNKIAKIQPLDLEVTVKNTGKYFGGEIVQLYLQDNECTVERPTKELINFEKVFLEPNQEKTIAFKVTVDDLAFYHPEKKQWLAEKGEFTLHIGKSSKEIIFKEGIIYE